VENEQLEKNLLRLVIYVPGEPVETIHGITYIPHVLNATNYNIKWVGLNCLSFTHSFAKLFTTRAGT
jgi:hypothetical protein